MDDISDTLAPKSDQLDAVDLAASGPRTFTITRVVVKGGDQPVDIHLAEFPRVWRPNLNARRLLKATALTCRRCETKAAKAVSR